MNMIATGQPLTEGQQSPGIAVCLAASPAEIDAAQGLRYSVFYEEMGARADAETRASRRDRDRYDAAAAHLVVVDDSATDLPCGIVATYRLIDADAAARCGGFYTAGEFDIAPLLATGQRLLELGRSCVHPRYRSGSVMQLLWRGIAEYVHAKSIDVMFGCASLPGTDPAAIAPQLAYLAAHHLAPEELRLRALAERRVEMAGPLGTDPRQAFLALPPLVKGYLRLGGWVGDGAVMDRQFNTIDVAIVLPTESVTSRYLRHYTRPPGDAA